jgi:UDP-3-O-[3-hydroxymyristoyl] glucosamine N-acyltransferase
MLADGTHLTTETGYWSAAPYLSYNFGDVSHLAPTGEYNPSQHYPFPAQSTLVGAEPGSDGSWWVASEAGSIYRFNFGSDPEGYAYGQDVDVAFPTPAGSVLSDFEISDTHMYAFIEDASNNVTIYRQRTLSPETMTVVASGKPYQALTILEDGALILAEVEYDVSLVRAGTLSRTSGTGPTWSVPLTKPILDLKALGGVIWMLDANGDVYKIDPTDGSGSSVAFFNTGLQTSLDFARGSHDGTELYVIPDDLCPTDPYKFLPGDCGCDYVEYDQFVYDEITGDPAMACVHRTAEVDINAALGANAHIGANSTVAAFASVGNDAFVGDRVTIEEQATIWADVNIQADVTIEGNAEIYSGVIIGRGARVNACAGVFWDAIIGRNSVVGAGAMILADATVGYSVNIPDDSEIGEFTVLGNLVSFPSGGPAYVGASGDIGQPTVVARGTSIGSGAHIYTGAVIGPSSIIGDGAVIEEGARLRKNTLVGAGAYIEADARIGRSSEIGAGSGVSESVYIRARVTVDPGVCVDSAVTMQSGITVSAPACVGAFNTTHVSNWDAFYPPISCGMAPPT